MPRATTCRVIGQRYKPSADQTDRRKVLQESPALRKGRQPAAAETESSRGNETVSMLAYSAIKNMANLKLEYSV